MSEGQAPVPSNTPAPGADAPAAQPTSGTNVPTQKPQPDKAAATPEQFEVKINGQVKRVSRDEAIRLAQLGYAATERFEQAAGLSKKAQSIIEGAQKNPIGALIEAGLSKEQIRTAMEAWYTQEFIEPETLSKEELRAKRAESELEKYKQREAEETERKRQAEEEQLTAAERVKLQQGIIDAMEAHKLPKNKFTVSRIAFYMRQSMAKGYEPPMELIVEQVRRERRDQVADMAENASYEQLVDIFGEATIKKIREEDLKQLRARRMGAGQSVPSAPRDQSPEKKTRPQDVTAYLKQMRLNK